MKNRIFSTDSAKAIKAPTVTASPSKPLAYGKDEMTAETLIHPPWGAAQVAALNRSPNAFLCPHHRAMRDVDRRLIATCEGWVCSRCDYTQSFAYAHQLENQALPAAATIQPRPCDSRQAANPSIVASSMSGAELWGRIRQLGYTQSSFARLLEINGRTVRRWISGRDHVPRIVELLIGHMAEKLTKN